MTFTHVHTYIHTATTLRNSNYCVATSPAAITNIHLIDQDDLLKQFVGKLQGRIELKY